MIWWSTGKTYLEVALIERHIKFAVRPEGATAFRQFFEDKYLPPMSETDGFVSARLLRPSDGEDEILMLLQFEDADASARWRESEIHQSLQPELQTLHSGMEIKGYESL
jgi:heme-degrading monooxygenase HmoA